MRAIPARSALLLLTLASFATPALADWPPSGVVIATPLPEIAGFMHPGEMVLLAAPDGSVVALGSGITSMDQYWGSQRVTPSGDLTPIWPGLLAEYTGSTDNSSGILARMGVGFSNAGELFTSWGERQPTIRSQRIANWASDAPTLEDRSFANPVGKTVFFARLAPALGSDVYYYYGDGGSGPRLMRRTAAGGVSPGWPVNGKRVINASVLDGALLPDGAGGVIVSARTSTSGFRVLRINSDSTVAWGLGLASQVDYEEQDFPQLLPSGTDGYLACWSESPFQTTSPTIALTRFLATGEMDPDWPAEGLQIASQSSSAPRFTVIPDGAGGAFVLFERDGEPRGTHILSNGTLDLGLAGPDVSLLDPEAFYDSSWFPWRQRMPLVAAPGKNGGLVFVWTDGRDAPAGSLRARWLTSSLAPDPSEPETPRRIPTHSATEAGVRAAISDGHGGIYVAWGDRLPGPPGAQNDVYLVMMNRVLASEFLSAPPAPHTASLALSAPRPNPARDAVALDVTLPDDSPARVELLDVAGRVVQARAVQGAGVRQVSFAELGSLAPGLYFARVSHPLGSAKSRVVVSR